MTIVYGNRVSFLTATTGTGTLNVGSPVNLFQLPAGASIASGSTVGYTIIDSPNWEVGTGIYTTGTPPTLTRATVEDSSSGAGVHQSLSGNATVSFVVTAAMYTLLAPLASPALTGTPTAPTASSGTNTTQIATTAFVAPAFNDIGRNKVHNPLFNIAQRGTGPFTTVVYTLDRWALSFTGDTDSVTQAALADADRIAIGDEEAVSCLQNAVTGVNSAANFSVIIHRIENVFRLSNKTVTVSFWAKAASGTPKIGVSIDQSFGTGGSPSAAVAGNGTAFTLSTTWTRYSGQFTIGSTSGKTLGTSGDFTGLDFWFSSGATQATRAGNIGVQTATFSLWGVQLEIGSTMTQLEKPDPRFDLANCQRFYFAAGVLAASTGTTAGTIFAQVALPVQMRVAPTVVGTNNSSSNVTSPTVVNSSTSPTSSVVGQGTCTSSGVYLLNTTYTASADL